MQDTTTTPRVETVLKPERPKMHKVILAWFEFSSHVMLAWRSQGE